MSNVVLIDMDIVAVAAAAAAEKRTFLYDGREYGTRTELKTSVTCIDEDAIETIVRPAPIAHARQNARMLLQSILDANAPITEYRGYVTGPGNYRYEIASIQSYKGNRDLASIPIWRSSVEEFLISECNTERVTGYEADDKLAVEFLKDPSRSVLCSLDKDFLQIENLRMYSWRKKETVRVSPTDALRNFYTQLLVGDVTDNIPGVAGVGAKGAEKLLGRLTDEKLMMTTCYAQYQKAYGPKAWEFLVENARLLFLCRTEEHLSNPKEAWTPCLTPGL